MKTYRSRTTIALLAASVLAWAGDFSGTALAHSVMVKLDGAEPITKTLIPAFGDIDLDDTGVFMVYPSPEPGPDLPGWDCTPIYEHRENTSPEVPDELKDHIKDQQPDLQYGDQNPPKSDAVLVGYDCVATFTEPIIWNPRKHCRDWTAVYEIKGHIPVDKNSFDVTFHDRNRATIDFDLDDSDFTVTLILAGKRVPRTSCDILHPFNETIVYAADIYIGGISGSVDVTLASAPPDALDGTNSTIYISSIDTNSFRLSIERNSVRIDTVTNNRIDELLLAGTAVLGPMNAPLVFGAASLTWLTDTDMASVALELATAVYGFASGDCNNTEDCLVDIVQGLLSQRIDLDMNFGLFEVHSGINTGNMFDSAEFISDITAQINEGIATPLAWTTGVATAGLNVQVDAALTNLVTSGASGTLTATWDVTVTNLLSGSCAAGLTGYVAPPAGPETGVNGDVDFTFPYSLVGEAAVAVIRQANFCSNYNFGPFSAVLSPNGPLRVARGAAKRIDLTLPLVLNATGPASGAATLDAVLHASPGVSQWGDIELELTTLYVTNLTGRITTTLGKVPATYNFGPGGATLTTPAGTFPTTNIAPVIENTLNIALGGFFPIPLSQRTTVYIAPHVYIRADGVVTRQGSFSVGLDIVDGSQPIDVAVARIEGAGPTRVLDIPFLGRYREVPLWAIVKNKDDWNVSPPVDVTIQIGVTTQVSWVPPLQPDEEFAIPFTAYVGLDSNDRVALEANILVTADIAANDPILLLKGLTTINDPNRANNVYRLTLNDAWFAPDYKVEIAGLEAMLQRRASGSIITNHNVVSGDFTLTTRIRNIGGAAPPANSIRRLNVYAEDEFYTFAFIGPLDIGDEIEVELDFHVPEGPSLMSCTYKFEAELVAGDRNAANDDDSLTLKVESDSCVGGGPTDADIVWIEEHGLEALEAKWEGLNIVTWGTDSRAGYDVGGSNAPILDRLEPLP